MQTIQKSLSVVALLGSLSLAMHAAAAQEPTAYTAHFRPADHAIGDVHPYFHQGVCYLYYLKPNGYHAALVTSTDLLHWQAQALTIDDSAPANARVPYYVLGVFRDRSDASTIFRTYYGHRGAMYGSESRDLLHWSAADAATHIPGVENQYRRRRDPFVFWNDDEEKYWCVMTTQMLEGEVEEAGAISLATSSNLRDWTNEGLLLHTGAMGEPECPQMFKLGEFWYLLFSEYDQAVGQPVCLRSKSARGPWETAPRELLDGKDLCAAQVAFDGQAWVLMGWIPDVPARRGNQAWGGHLALPRELFATESGRLDCRLHRSILERLRGELLVSQSSGESVAASQPLEMSVELPSSSLDIEVIWERATEGASWVASFQTESTAGQVGSIHVSIESDRIQIRDDHDEVWSELPLEVGEIVDEEQRVEIRMIVDHDILEVHLSNSRSLVARVPINMEGTTLRSVASDPNESKERSTVTLNVFRLGNVTAGETP